MTDADPDRREVFPGQVYVDLWRGLFRDEVRIWKDVSPALGGLLGRSTVWRGRGDDEFDTVVELVRQEYAK